MEQEAQESSRTSRVQLSPTLVVVVVVEHLPVAQEAQAVEQQVVLVLPQEMLELQTQAVAVVEPRLQQVALVVPVS